VPECARKDRNRRRVRINATAARKISCIEGGAAPKNEVYCVFGMAGAVLLQTIGRRTFFTRRGGRQGICNLFVSLLDPLLQRVRISGICDIQFN
jgi:hypothetical protein